MNSSIPSESLSGSIVSQLYHGRPHLVFIEHEGNSIRAVSEVTRDGAGYKSKGPRLNFPNAKNVDACELCAEYLQQIYGKFS